MIVLKTMGTTKFSRYATAHSITEKWFRKHRFGQSYFSRTTNVQEWINEEKILLNPPFLTLFFIVDPQGIILSRPVRGDIYFSLLHSERNSRKQVCNKLFFLRDWISKSGCFFYDERRIELPNNFLRIEFTRKSTDISIPTIKRLS